MEDPRRHLVVEVTRGSAKHDTERSKLQVAALLSGTWRLRHHSCTTGAFAVKGTPFEIVIMRQPLIF